MQSCVISGTMFQVKLLAIVLRNGSRYTYQPVVPRCVGMVISRIPDFVSLCMCPRSKCKTVRAVNSKLGTHIVYGRTSACIDPEVKISRLGLGYGYDGREVWVCMSIDQHIIIESCFLARCTICMTSVMLVDCDFIEQQNVQIGI